MGTGTMGNFCMGEDVKGVPEDTVKQGMAAFEQHYNDNDLDFCVKCYTDECHVTVNGGTEKGGFGPFKNPAEVTAFLNKLRNELGGTTMKFTVTKVEGCKHLDTWTAV